MSKRIKCIESDPHRRVIVGKVYEVLKEDVDHYYLMDEESGGWWPKRRFEVVDDEPSHPPTITASESVSDIPTPPEQEKPFDFEAYNGLKSGSFRL